MRDITRMAQPTVGPVGGLCPTTRQQLKRHAVGLPPTARGSVYVSQ